MAFSRHFDEGDRSQSQRAPAPPNDAHHGFLPSELFGNDQPMISPHSPADSDYHDHDPDLSDLDCTMSETTSRTTYSSYQCDTLNEASLIGLPTSVTSNHSPWSSYNTRGSYDDNPTLHCDECGAAFHGRYRNSNLSRHRRHMHSKPQEYFCTVLTCNRTFRRQDARLKHERRKHPELMHPAPQRKGKGSELSYRDDRSSVSYSVSDDGHAASDIETAIRHATNQMSTHRISDDTRMPGRSSSAQRYFAELRKSLDKRAYLHFCEVFFTRWADIVEDLRKKRSNTHVVFAQALDVIRKEAHFDQETLFKSSGNIISTTNSHSRNRSYHGQSSITANGTFSRVSSGRVSKRHGHNENPARESRFGPLLLQYNESEELKTKKLDCPIHKHHIMNGIQPPCGGFAADHMSQIRNHLDPERSMRHGRFPQFIKRCTQCKEDVIDRQDWTRHELNQCASREQHRGDRISRWIRLYLNLYPDAPRVPVPYVGDNNWLSNNDSQNHFLGNRPHGRIRPEPRMDEPDISSDPQSFNAAFAVIFRDVSRLRRDMLDEAARTFDSEQRAILTSQVEAEFNMIRDSLLRGPPSQPTHPQTNPTTVEYGISNQDPNAPFEYIHPIDAQPPQILVNEPLPPSNVSTQSSGQGYETGSPQPHQSSMTSSRPELYDEYVRSRGDMYPSHLSPFMAPSPLGFFDQAQPADCPPPPVTNERMNQDLLLTGAPFGESQSSSLNVELDFNVTDDIRKYRNDYHHGNF